MQHTYMLHTYIRKAKTGEVGQLLGEKKRFFHFKTVYLKLSLQQMKRPIFDRVVYGISFRTISMLKNNVKDHVG